MMDDQLFNKKTDEEMIEECLKKIENILYQDNKYSDKNMAEEILSLLEAEYDI